MVGLEYGEELRWSRILGEWSNTSGYEMGSSLATVYSIAKTFPAENFEHE